MTVYLVGAGPGDPGLITVRGAELLRAADVVVYDRLANAALLDLAPPGAVRISVGKAPGNVELDQDGINALLVEQGAIADLVVRLKGGDPFVFGRGGEEAEALRDAGIAFEIVPGITSAIAAAAYAGVPVTHRGLSTHFTVVTGHEDPEKGSTDTDWEALARIGGTLVILMGVGNLAEIAARLQAGGRDAHTPVAAIRNGTRADQQTIRATLATIADAGVRSPSAIVVGAVGALDLAWFETRPLFGRTVAITRAREQASGLKRDLEALGATVVEMPTIAIEPMAFTVPDLAAYAWVAFTSPNGVEALFTELNAAGRDARAFGPARVAAIGPGTATALAAHGVIADLVPDRFVAESLVDAWPAPETEPERVLIVRPQDARDVLDAGLTTRGYTVDALVVYRTAPEAIAAEAKERLVAGAIDAVTLTSSSTATNLVAALGEVPEVLRADAAAATAVISIGPVTTQTAVELGLRVDVEADPHTIAGLLQALVDRLGPSTPR